MPFAPNPFRAEKSQIPEIDKLEVRLAKLCKTTIPKLLSKVLSVWASSELFISLHNSRNDHN
jgi:hypothetical protein